MKASKPLAELPQVAASATVPVASIAVRASAAIFTFRIVFSRFDPETQFVCR
jgi:hypothetical protein